MQLRILSLHCKQLNFPLKFINFLPLLISLFLAASPFFLFGCASSGVQREAAANVDLGVQNAKNLVKTDGDVADSYQNANQTIKGALIGGAVGAATGAVSSGIGVVPGTAVGAIFGASYGAYIDSTTDKRDRLENRGVTVVVLGDQVLIVLRSARIFEYQTSTVKPQAYSTLALVAKYINRFEKIMVKIAAYTNDSGSREGDVALSTQQADKVAKLLSASGVDARILYATGEGGIRLVDDTALDWDASDNYRIEITLERLYV